MNSLSINSSVESEESELIHKNTHTDIFLTHIYDCCHGARCCIGCLEQKYHRLQYNTTGQMWFVFKSGYTFREEVRVAG